MPGLELTDPHLSSGGGLEEMSLGAANRANMGIEAAAYSQSEREQYNARVRGGNKAGNAMAGAASGAMIGAQLGGPYGAAIGGVAGGIMGLMR